MVSGDVLLAGAEGLLLEADVDGVRASGDNGIIDTDFRRGECTTCDSIGLIP